MDRGPGGSPKTFSDPESTFSLPTMHFSKVVFPQPDGPTKRMFWFYSNLETKKIVMKPV